MGSARLLWANHLRALATIAVIMLHVASTISSVYPGISKSYFLTSIIFDASVRWGVPVFIMLSGSFALENYDDRMRDFYTKMFYRIILPFLFWSIVYLFFFSWKDLIDPGKNAGQLISFIGKQFLGGTASHLWFVYVIVSMYLVFPFLSKWTRMAVEKEYIFFFALWAFFLLIDPYLASYDINFNYEFFSGFIGYIVLGNYLFKTPRKFNRLLLFLLFLKGFLYTAIRTWFVSVHQNEVSEIFMENLSLNVCLMSFSVYLIFKHGNYGSNSNWQRLVDSICRYSYGIYLSHLLILNIFLRIGLRFDFIHPAMSIPLITIACLCISCGLIMAMKRIPLLRELAG